jgi:hypothetical protein
MQVILRERKMQPASLLVLIAEAVLGVCFGKIMPSSPLLGLRSIAPMLAEGISSYLGGIGLVTVMGGVAELIGLALRVPLTRLLPRSLVKIGTPQVCFPTICVFVGGAMFSWYIWSYLHPF